MAAEDQDEETGMPKMQVEQNFEYKEEIQFRGEQVDGDSQKKIFDDVGNKADMAEDSMMKDQNLPAIERSKSGMDKLVGGFMDNTAGEQQSDMDYLAISRNK